MVGRCVVVMTQPVMVQTMTLWSPPHLGFMDLCSVLSSEVTAQLLLAVLTVTSEQVVTQPQAESAP